MYSWTPFPGDGRLTPDVGQLRQALGSYPTGVCLITMTTPQGKREGMTINSFASVSLDPPLVLCSVRDAARSADAFMTTRHFALHVLSAAQRELAQHFARPAADKFSAFEDAFEPGQAGCPLLRSSVARFECATYSRHTEGDHMVLVGRVERYARHDTAPLLFYQRRMGSLWELAALSTPPSDTASTLQAATPRTA